MACAFLGGEGTLDVAVVHTLPEEEWSGFVAEHPAGNIFHTPEMFRVFERARGYHPSLWAAIGSDDRVLALLLPVKVTVMNGLFSRMTARSILYGGVLCEASPEGQTAVRRLLAEYNRGGGQGSLFTEVRNLADTEIFQPILQGYGYTYEAYENFLIDLDLPAEEVWRSIKKSARKKIRRALDKDQLTVEEVREREQIGTWYSLLKKTYHRVGVPLADISLFQAAFDILHPKGLIQFLLGRVDDTYVAASVALLYKNVIYGWYRGFDRRYSSYLPNDLMVWNVLEWGTANGYRLFDFGGAGKPGQDYSPRRFKAKFGGELVEFGRNTHVHSKLRLQLSQVGYRLYRQFLSK
jgi:serine/alanine adding enzyme